NWREVRKYLAMGVYSVDHIIKEVSNAIWKHAILFNRITKDTAMVLHEQLKRMIEEEILILEPENLYVDKAFKISLNHKITFYDSIYIAQALKYGELLTSDQKQAEISKKLNIKTHHIE
ncbi:MAG: type II toxin-antitoxin system VapC family toxin, partial [Candidatus Odinarchaeota archaeon]|nr:type II toxin-antitoxin system VapC family toxin [Candidatus Odinarchaeota archaeon]